MAGKCLILKGIFLADVGVVERHQMTIKQIRWKRSLLQAQCGR
jgi:hypothetical protein